MRQRRQGVLFLHCNTGDNVCSIPERHISLSTRWRIPRHDNQIQVNQDVEPQHGVPDLEAGSRQSKTLAAVSNEYKSKRKCKVEYCGRVDLKINDEVESVTGRWCDDHNYGQEPFHEVRAERCAERAGGCPEAWVWQNTLSDDCEQWYQKQVSVQHLPSAFTDHTRRSNQDSEQITKST